MKLSFSASFGPPCSRSWPRIGGSGTDPNRLGADGPAAAAADHDSVVTAAAGPNAPATATARPGATSISPNEIVDAGHRFFGGVSRGLAMIIEKAVSQWGQPNGYVLGEEAGGAFVGGLRYGDGTLYTKNAGDLRVFWQGPSVGFDAGADGARTMMLVYNLPRTEAIFDRFGGINGSAYFIGGFGMTALTADNIVLVPIRSGVGLAARRQSRLPQIHRPPDLESVLTGIPLIRPRRRS